MKVWATTDIGLTAYMMLKGLKLVSTYNADARQKSFGFDVSDSTKQALMKRCIQEYSQNTNECRQMIDNIRYLKGLVYSDATERS